MSKTIMKENIEKAQVEIGEKESIVKIGKMRQDFHFMPQTGWLNDPNGLVCYKGQYHYFYQFYPYAGFWGSMHWGHAVSSDMLHWKHLPPALAPSEVYDDHYLGGCFSGSAIEYNGKLYLIYTGAANNGDGLKQCQCIRSVFNDEERNLIVNYTYQFANMEKTEVLAMKLRDALDEPE